MNGDRSYLVTMNLGGMECLRGRSIDGWLIDWTFCKGWRTDHAARLTSCPLIIQTSSQIWQAGHILKRCSQTQMASEARQIHNRFAQIWTRSCKCHLYHLDLVSASPKTFNALCYVLWLFATYIGTVRYITYIIYAKERGCGKEEGERKRDVTKFNISSLHIIFFTLMKIDALMQSAKVNSIRKL